jgi:predicted flap endonuclease-1-like 5' DNA nuclease
MAWVLWDIVFPLFVTFAIGLLTGWLLWRWRRHKAPVQAVAASVAGISSADTGDLSASSATALIEERDAALLRAEEAELRITALNEELSKIPAGDSASVPSGVQPDVQPESNETDEQIEALNSKLASEQAAKAELEQAFMDLNNRYAALNGKLEDVMDVENANAVKDAVTIQNKYENSQQQIAESNEKIHAITEQHKAQTEHLTRKLADKESALAQLQLEKDEALNKLRLMDAAASEASQPPSASVHHLASYARGDEVVAESSSSAGSEAGVEPAVADTTAEADVQKNVSDTAQSAPADQPASIDREENVASKVVIVGDQSVATGSEESAQNSTAETETGGAITTASGYVPVSWQVPEHAPDKSERDNLQKIKGIGPVLEKLLHETGIYYFEQVAGLDSQGVAELDSQLPQFSGRIDRDNWVDQAKSLQQQKYGQAATGG